MPSMISKLLILGIWLCIGCSAAWETYAEDVTIDFGKESVKDPLLEFSFPVGKDKIEFLKEGIRIRQFSDQRDVESTGCGMKFFSNASGNFRFELDLRINRLERPTLGWGQGILLQFRFEGPPDTVKSIGCIANQQFARGFWGKVDDEYGLYFSKESEFSDGTLRVERLGEELLFSYRNSSSQDFQQVFSRPCHAANLAAVQVWCSRQQGGGNTNADFLLRSLRFESDNMFVSNAHQTKRWAWWYIPVAIILANAIGFVVVKVRK